MIYATGFGTGLIWLVLALTGLVQKMAAVTPRSVVRGIQVALGIMLAIEGFKMISTGWILGVVSIAIVILLRKSKYAPAAIVLIVLGIAVVGVKGELAGSIHPGFTLPPYHAVQSTGNMAGACSSWFRTDSTDGNECRNCH